MDIQRNGSQPSGKSLGEYFTGNVHVQPLFQSPRPTQVAGANVTFEPGARSAWHTHPCGQVPIVTSGLGDRGDHAPGFLCRLAGGEHGAADCAPRVRGSENRKLMS